MSEKSLGSSIGQRDPKVCAQTYTFRVKWELRLGRAHDGGFRRFPVGGIVLFLCGCCEPAVAESEGREPASAGFCLGIALLAVVECPGLLLVSYTPFCLIT